MKHALLPSTLLAALLLSACSKDDDPAAQLPPATQTGANTFGCLVNGKAWTPKGSSFTVSYDYTYHDGTLNVVSSRYGQNPANDEVVGIASDSIRRTGVFRIRPNGRHQASYINRSPSCGQNHSGDSDTYSRGAITITRLDLQTGIVSGTFWFTLYKPGCDSIHVTNGRFDRKL